jgi:oligopeptide/dipeptide ABC transporter ATP-binding protein
MERAMSANGFPAGQAGELPAGERSGDSATDAPLLEVSDLRVDFRLGGRVVRAVDRLNYTVPRARTVALIGESGSGKTVSSRAIIGLLPSNSRITGSVRFEGNELLGLSERRMRKVRGSQIAMVFQDPARSLNPTVRIGPQITEAIHLHADMSKAAAHDRAVELMELVRLPAAQERFGQYPHQLSGGMRQRVMIAIALAAQPKLLIADEATTALDVTTQAQIMELLRDLQQRLGMALIMISHDLGLAASFADDVLVMYAGRGVEHASTRKLFEHVRMPYTRALLDAIPRLENPSHARLAAVPGQPPDLAEEQVGCPFAPRCPKATEKCREHAPPFEEQEPAHLWACWHPIGVDGES